ncbi:MAG TPA: winged helix-turn-helix domain-containing protein [Jiangellaceae bacterium]
MALAGSGRAAEPLEPAVAVPVIVGIALDDVIRRRLASLLDGIGVLMFSPDVATAHAMLSRAGDREHGDDDASPDMPVVRVGELEVDRVRCRVRWRGMPLALTKRERDLLACLAAEPGRVWTYRQLNEVAWEQVYLDPGPVHAAVKRLRKRLRETGVAVRIDAVRGVGYQLVPPGEA